jgi:glycerol dehydrogenase
MMEERSQEFLDKIYGFCKSVGLPTTLKELGMPEFTDDALKMVSDDASKSILIASMPKASAAPDDEGRFYNPEEIFNCLKAADAYGMAF